LDGFEARLVAYVDTGFLELFVPRSRHFGVFPLRGDFEGS
jgi:hypothetical protein